MAIFQEQNRQEMRHQIGRNTGDVLISTVTATVDTLSLQDTLGLASFNDDDINGRRVLIYDATGSIVDGEESVVLDFDGGTSDATLKHAFTAATTDGDKYEMWTTLIPDEVNDAIDQAIIDVSNRALVDRATDSNWTQANKYIYDWLVPYAFGNDFKSVYKVEYCAEVKTYKVIHACDVVWDELVDTDVTESLDTTFKVEGSGSLKLVVAAGCAAGDILATMDITAVDISDCDQLEIWIYSTVALDAGDLQVLLDNTASCASPLESLDIPATTANTMTRHVIDLANPKSDTAIISVGLKMIVDKAAFTLWSDDIRTTDSESKRYMELNPEYWGINRGSSPTLHIKSTGLAIVGDYTQIRISGYSSPDLMTDDTTDCEVDPSFIVHWATAHLLLNHSKSASLELENRQNVGDRHMAMAQEIKASLVPNYPPNTRFV